LAKINQIWSVIFLFLNYLTFCKKMSDIFLKNVIVILAAETRKAKCSVFVATKIPVLLVIHFFNLNPYKKGILFKKKNNLGKKVTNLHRNLQSFWIFRSRGLLRKDPDRLRWLFASEWIGILTVAGSKRRILRLLLQRIAWS